MDEVEKLGDSLAEHYHEVVTTNLMELSVVVVAVAIFLVLVRLYQRWKKRKGYRMVLKDRNDKNHALLTRIINDGLFEAECAGEISAKEVRDLYKEMSEKLNLPDLVPKKQRLAIVKEELKRLRFSDDPEIVKMRDHHPNIPGGPPTPIVRQRFGNAVGKLAARIRVVK